MRQAVYRFRSLSQSFEQRFTTLKLAMRKAYLDFVYKRFNPERIDLGEETYDLNAMQHYWEKEGWSK